MNEHARKYLAEIGKTGGQSGKGECKRRTPEHYRRIAKLGVAARLRRWAAKRGGVASLTR